MLRTVADVQRILDDNRRMSDMIAALQKQERQLATNNRSQKVDIESLNGRLKQFGVENDELLERLAEMKRNSVRREQKYERDMRAVAEKLSRLEAAAAGLPLLPPVALPVAARPGPAVDNAANNQLIRNTQMELDKLLQELEKERGRQRDLARLNDDLKRQLEAKNANPTQVEFPCMHQDQDSEDKTNLEQRIIDLTRELENMSMKLTEAGKRNADLTNQIDRLNREKSELTSKNNDLAQTVEKLQTERAGIARNEQTLKDQIEHLKQSIANSANTEAELRKQIQAAQSRNEEIDRELQQMHEAQREAKRAEQALKEDVEKLKKSLADGTSRETELKRKLERAQEENEKALKKLKQDIEERDGSIKKLQREKDDNENVIKRLKKEAEESANHIKKLQKEIEEKENSIRKMRKELEEHENTVRKLQSQIQENEEAIRKLQSEVDERENSIKELQKQVEEREESLRRMQKEMEEHVNTVKKMQKEIDEKTHELKRRIDEIEALQKANNELIKAERETKERLEQAKRDHENAMKEKQREIENLKSQLHTTESELKQVREERDKMLQTWVPRKQLEEAEAKLARMKQAFDETSKKLAETQKAKEEQERRFAAKEKELKAEIERIGTELHGVHEQLNEATERIRDLASTNARLIERHRQRKKQMEKELEKLRAELSEQERLLGEKLKAKDAQFRAEKEKMAEIWGEKERELKHKVKIKDLEMKAEMEKMKSKSDQLEKAFALKLGQKDEETKKQAQRFTEQLEEKGKLLDELQAKNKELQAAVDEHVRKTHEEESLRTANEELKQKAGKLERAIVRLRLENDELREFKMYSAKNENVRELVTEQTTHIADLQLEVEVLRRTVKDLSASKARSSPRPSRRSLAPIDGSDAAGLFIGQKPQLFNETLMMFGGVGGGGGFSGRQPPESLMDANLLRLELEEARNKLKIGNDRIAQMERWLDTIYSDGELGVGPGGQQESVRAGIDARGATTRRSNKTETQRNTSKQNKRR